MTINPLILLVEDHKITQLAGKKILEAIGCLVEVAATGEDAIKMVSEKNYSVIFMDIGLGSTDGYMVTSAIRKMANANSRIPIIALTAHSHAEVEPKAVVSGMDYVMTKPLLIENARKVIAQFLQNESTND